jgi:putative oxidoreductase
MNNRIRTFLSPKPVLLDKILATIRIVIGLLMVYHGYEVFNSEVMSGYIKWDVFQNKAATFLVYAGKSTELIAGILLTLGLFTRVGAVLLIGTMLYITFLVGHGRFWYEDQHPFMFVLFGVLFLFSGPGAWSLDGLFWKENSSN